MDDDIFGSYGFNDRLTRTGRIGSNRSPPRLHHGLVVYVVVAIERGVIRQAAIRDRQTDIEVLGVFMSEQEAQAFCDSRDPLHHRHLVVHQTTMRTHVNDRLNDRRTFHPEIYS